MCDVELKGQEEKREQEIEQAVGISRDVWGGGRCTLSRSGIIHKGRKHDVKAVRKLSDISSSSIQESSGRGEEIHILVRGGGQGMVRIKWDAGWRWEGIAQHVLTEAFV